MPDRDFTLNVELRDQTLDRFVDQLRIVSPLLAARVADAVASLNPALELEQMAQL